MKFHVTALQSRVAPPKSGLLTSLLTIAFIITGCQRRIPEPSTGPNIGNLSSRQIIILSAFTDPPLSWIIQSIFTTYSINLTPLPSRCLRPGDLLVVPEECLPKANQRFSAFPTR